MRHYTFSVWNNSKQERLDTFIRSLFPVLSRSLIQQLIAEEQVTVNSKKSTAHYIPKKHDILKITVPALQQTGIIPAEIPLDILYEDADILVLNKQAGLVVHPTDNGGHISDSLVNALLFHRPKTWSINNNSRPGIVHRLDKDTSGVMVVAKNDLAMRNLVQQWEKHTVSKEYLTLLIGHLQPEKGAIEAPLGRSFVDRKKIGIRVGKSGRYALTQYEVLEYVGDYSLVKVTIVTGRTHQIRAHFQSIGFPVVGDSTYGKASVNNWFMEHCALPGQFLHAYKLGINLPSTKKRREFTAPLPTDLERTLDILQKGKTTSSQR